MSEEQNTPFTRTIECLQLSKRAIGNAQSLMAAAKQHRALLPGDYKLLTHAKINLSEANDKIQTIIDVLRIQTK